MTATLSLDRATALMARKRRAALAIPAVIVLYLVYVFFAFDVPGLLGRARLDNAALLVADSYSHKVHVTRDNSSGEIGYSFEGETKGRYPEGQRPDFVTVEPSGDQVIALHDGHQVRFAADGLVTYTRPDAPPIEIRVTDGTVTSNLPADPGPGFNVSNSRIAITTEAGRLTVTRSKAEVFRYSFGWALFWFTLDSPYHGQGLWTILTGPQIDPARSNIAGALEDFWTNRMWRHGDVAWAIGETVLMAFLGTFGGALVALPLGFLAARNLAPLAALRFGLKRLFDLVRGIDSLIWTIILSRAFGPGPMTGALAILVTDTGSFGKMFAEALENIDDKQVEGIASTGANPVQRWRFGVLPQVLPVLMAQVLYFLESNTRSATVVGAITGGGIGLLLTQALQTQKDWEDVAYYIVLIVLMVMLMDWISGALRRRLIKGS